ncbi:hypothetical protein JXA88_08100 [Candidatus Fermentibacteria bacterium]|nr:hypothetical protein [Candidatus Fermentibacteria bacterium]
MSRLVPDVPIPEHDLDGTLDALREIDSRQSDQGGYDRLVWPYHLMRPDDVPVGVLLTVLVDTPDVPARYREGYLTQLSAYLKVSKARKTPSIMIQIRNAQGGSIPNALDAAIRRAVEHVLLLLGPSAGEEGARSHLEFTFTLGRLEAVAEIQGRSILLPVALVAANALGEQLNLPHQMCPSQQIAWTGDLDEEGQIRPVGSLREKVERVAASRLRGIAYPAEVHEEMSTAVRGLLASSRVETQCYPLRSIRDALGSHHLVTIKKRGPATRLMAVVSQGRPGRRLMTVFACAIVLVAAAWSIPRLAWWLDSRPAEVRLAPDHQHMLLSNSKGRCIRRFPVVHTTNRFSKLIDVDGLAGSEIVYGTAVEDSVPGTLFCLDSRGNELWRFRAGNNLECPLPWDVADNFGISGVVLLRGPTCQDHWLAVSCYHRPTGVCQTAVLSSSGEHLHSFWNPGHHGSAFFCNGTEKSAVYDIDQDGYEEFICTGTNVPCRSPVVVVLDPRGGCGRGPMYETDDAATGYQDYIIFPTPIGLPEALGMSRLDATNARVEHHNGVIILSVQISARLPGWKMPEPVFRYFLDTDLNVVDFYACDAFKVWSEKARRNNVITWDARSEAFDRSMRRIQVLHGSKHLRRQSHR